jgi:GT2 family glycosyltransferase
MSPDVSESDVDLSVCIVTCNQWAHTEVALASVFKYGGHWRKEVIVVDNGSTDGTPDRIRAAFPEVFVRAIGRNIWYAPAMNLALARARGRYVLTLSHDAALTSGAVDQMIRFMQAHPSAGLAGPRTVDAAGVLVTTLHSPNLWLTIGGEIVPIKKWLRGARWLRHLATRLAPDMSGLTANYGASHRVAVVDGGCILASRAVLERVGLLDPYLPQGPDDYDWCRRVVDAGLEVWYVAESGIVHSTAPREEFSKLPAHYFRLRVPQICYLYRKYHRGRRAAVFCWTASILLWKWRLEARLRYGARNPYDAVLEEAIRLCLDRDLYRTTIDDILAPASVAAVPVRA